MSEEKQQQPPPSSQEYPLFGYVYELDGTYREPIELGTATQVENFLTRVALPCIDHNQEIRITDVDDCLVFWAKGGEVKWPNDTMIPPPSE